MNLRSPNLKHLHRLCIAAAVMGALVPTFSRAASGDAALDAAMAERLALIADDSVVSDQTPEPILRQAAALLDLARECNPKEVRFARSSAAVLLRLGEADRALAALSAVRALDPKDQLAQIQYVDLSANKLESADAREAYLQQVIDAGSLAAEIRSHAAISLMDLLYQRSEDRRAGEMLDKALSLNPQNIAALSQRYRQVTQSGDALMRAKALSDLVVASPIDPARLEIVAHECIASGDYINAHDFYEYIFNVRINRGQSPGIENLIDLAGAEMMNGTTSDIGPLMKQAVGSVKDDGRLFAIDLLIQQFDRAKPEELAPAVAAARGVYLASLAGVSQVLNQPEKQEMPTTSPAVPMPDVAADAAKLNAGGPAQLKTAYTIALAEQLWFDLYFRAAPVDDTAIGALATLLGSDSDPLVVRLQGWKLLSAGHADEAKVKLAAVADRDGYAKLGLAAAQAATGQTEESKKTIAELMAARPSGMLAVFLGTAARKSEVKSQPTDAEQEVAKVFSALKRPVGDALENSRAFYLLSAQPANVSFGPGEPLLARVTLQNNGRQPLTIGPGGMIEPRFYIDISIKGDAQRSFPAAVVGQWSGAIRLVPGQQISQVVRLDRGPANTFFRQYPTPMMTVTGILTANGIPTQRGTVAAAGGQQTTVGAVMERRASPLFVEAFRAKVLDRIANGSPLERLNNMELAAAVVPLLEQQKENQEAKTAAEQIRTAIDTQLAKEPVPEVKAWCSVARAAAGAGTIDIGPMMRLNSPVAKAAGLILARSLGGDARRNFAQNVINDGVQGPVAELARGVLEQPDPPPTTQPADSSGGRSTGPGSAP